MRTARSSSRPGGSPPGTPWDQATPLDQSPPPGADPPRTRHPGSRPPPEADPPRADPPGPGTPPGVDPPTHPSVDRITDTCENITLPQLHCGW